MNIYILMEYGLVAARKAWAGRSWKPKQEHLLLSRTEEASARVLPMTLSTILFQGLDFDYGIIKELSQE